ncbi:MAG: phosphate ABC transporter substrate-binding protein PstS [Actinomyces sp.]|nr:phosphate ABC transporter substrate-binding protein PstS [Actinomyces sp.]MDU7730331.1 phosphate ABC transporter substrate-binding protein PstS [Actinomyces sp.]
MTVHARTKLLVTLAGATTMTLALAACGGGDKAESTGADNGASGDSQSAQDEVAPATDLSGSVAGSGASSQEAAMEAWKAGFNELNPDVTVSYEAVGSGTGITQFTSKQVAWAGSDAPLEGDEIAAAEARCGGPAWDLPVYISPVAVIFNLEGVDSLNMDAATIAKIFAGEITNWNDPAIAKANPDAQLPDLAITPVHRSDKSGTTENFTDYLHSAAPEAWPTDPGKEWPVSGGESGDKTSGLVQAVQAGNGTIGYADASQAGNLGTVALAAADGTYVSFSAETAAKAAETAERVADRDANDIALSVNRVPETNDSYPLILISYSIVCSTYEDANEAELVKAFVGYQASEEGQQMAADNAGAAPISEAMRSEINGVLDQIK